MRITGMNGQFTRPAATNQVADLLNKRVQQSHLGDEQDLRLKKMTLAKLDQADPKGSGRSEAVITAGGSISPLNQALSTYTNLLDGLEPVEKYLAVLEKRELALQEAQANSQTTQEDLEALEQGISLVKSRIQDQVNLMTDFYGKFYMGVSRLNQQSPLLPPGFEGLSAQGLGLADLAGKSSAEISDLYHHAVTALSDYKAQLSEKAGIVNEPRQTPVDRTSQAWQDEIEELDRSLQPFQVIEKMEVDYSQSIDIRL
ncbi:MAG: hypothetical protein E6Y08_22185 [Paenibacillus sp.]|uniref:hypothetical protein n=1 Tax=Paenibacillus sp. TaxID=58172 RepID=UPI00290B3050|nr:hypothetical protein [Paenibacillus sp.]MDU4698530.1 hypothetical protein [Paenibacillus sp.]